MFGKNRAARKRGRRPSIVRPRPLLEPLEPRLVPSVDVTSYHYDNASTGLNPNEMNLTPANVQVGSFGKEFTTTVDGQVYAEPLVLNNVAIAGGPNTQAGAVGTHNVVFVATENDSLYAIDQTSGAVLWERSFLDPGADDALPGASSVTAVPDADFGSTDISPEVGITGTPVIDPGTGTLYLVTMTKEMVGSTAHYVQRLHAVNVADGTDVATPYVIGDTTNDDSGDHNNTQVYVYGTGDGAVPDPYTNTGKQVVQFDAITENQRAALSLVNGNVYVSWASHSDNGPYHGWVASWDVSNVRSQGFRLDGVFNTTPNHGEGGIWMGGGQLAFEPDGSAFYLETGNGDGTPVTVDPNTGLPVGGDYSEAVVKIVADPTTSPTNQNVNGWGLKAIDFFIPYNQPALDRVDADFGSGAPMLLPASAGIPGHPDLMVVGGKEGKIYLLDRNGLGGFNANNDNVLNNADNGSGNWTPPVVLNGILSTPAYFNGTLYYVSGYDDVATAFAITPDGTLTATSQTTNQFGYLPGSPVVSSDGSSNGIVWIVDRNTNTLRAYDASSLSTELWDSDQKANGSDKLGAAVKFATPVEANGEVFVGTADSLVVYGLTPPSNGVPLAPTNLAATALSGTSARLSWADPTTAPNTATGYLIEESSDGGQTFVQVTTAPAGTTSLDVGGLTAGQTYSFRIRGINPQGDSAYSNVAGVTTSAGGSQAPLAPSGLGAVPASATSVGLTWTDNSANQTGYYLDRATDPDFTQNLITQTLPASPDSFTDTAAGLAPGDTYYYRLRAFNAAGDSASSNVSAVTIPLAPAKPTNAAVTRVTAGEIDLSWTDNAGRSASGYDILRAADHGSFTLYATLPPNTGAVPGTYTWSDTNVDPGTFYEYHIEAVNVSGHNDFTGTNATTLTAAPTGLAALTAPGTIDLTWNAVAGAVSYNVYRGTTSGGEGATPFASGLTTPSFTDTAVTDGQTYYYFVTAVNGNAPPLANEGAASGEVFAQAGVIVSPPPAPPPPPPPSPPPPPAPLPAPAPPPHPSAEDHLPTPASPPHGGFTANLEPFLGLLLRAQTPDGQPVGPNLILPFPFAAFSKVEQVTPDADGGATMVLDILFLQGVSLHYNSAGFLTGVVL